MTSVEMIPSKELSFEELHQIQRMFTSEGILGSISSKCIIRGGAALPPPGLDLVIAATVGGFFGAMGGDIWQKLKGLLPKIISYLRQRRCESFLDIALVLKRGEESLLFIEIPTEPEIDLGYALERLPRHLKRIKARRRWVRFDTNRGLWESSKGALPRGFPSSYRLRGMPTLSEVGTFTLSVDLISEWYGLSQNLVRHLARTGIIDGIKMGGKWFIKPASLESYVREKCKQLAPE